MKAQQKREPVDLLFDNIRKIRLLSDIITHLNELESKELEFIIEGEGFFKTQYKRIKNSINDQAIKKAQKKLEEKIEKYNEIANEEINIYHKSGYLKDLIKEIKNESKTLSKIIFKDDSYKLGKIEFVMNVLCDDFTSFENSDEINQEISIILDEDEDFLSDIQDQLTEAYQKIGIKPNDGIVTKLQAPILALIIANPIVSMGLIGVTLADCVTALCGLKFSIFNKLKDETTKVIDSIQKDVLLKQFYDLNVEQTSFCLAKSIVLLLQVNKYRENDPVAQEIYESYVETYIDIKSDITLKMLLDGKIEENFEKAKVINNMDIYLATKLQK